MTDTVKANFHSGKLSVDWNGQENFSLSCELWVGTNDFNTKKNFLVRSNPRIDNFPEWKLAFTVSVIPGGQPADISDNDAQLIGQHVRRTNCYANQSIKNFEDND